MSNSNKSVKRGVLIGALTLTLLSGVAVAKGQFGHKGGPFGVGFHSQMNRMIEKLDLTGEQAVEVEKLMSEQSGQRGSMIQGVSEIHKLIDQGYVDQAAEQAANSARDRVYKMAETKRRLSEILTPEQLAKMEELKQRRKERFNRVKGRKASDVDS